MDCPLGLIHHPVNPPETDHRSLSHRISNEPLEVLIRRFDADGDPTGNRSTDGTRTMTLCEFCDLFQKNGECRLGLDRPKRMNCRSFDPRVGNFCANPDDFVSERQIVQMAVYFDIKGAELKKIRVMAAREAAERAE